jgi:hypothetical protein
MGPPGTNLVITKTMTVIPRKVGMINKRRLMIYAVIFTGYSFFIIFLISENINHLKAKRGYTGK